MSAHASRAIRYWSSAFRPAFVSSDCSNTAYNTPPRNFAAKNHPSPTWITTSASIRRNAALRREIVHAVPASNARRSLPSRNPPSTAPPRSANTWDSHVPPSTSVACSSIVENSCGSSGLTVAKAFRLRRVAVRLKARRRSPSACWCRSPARTSDSMPTADALKSAAAESGWHWPRPSPPRLPQPQTPCATSWRHASAFASGS